MPTRLTLPVLVVVSTFSLLSACAANPERLDSPAKAAFDASPVTNADVTRIERYEVLLPARERLPYRGAYAQAFGPSLPFAPGSGLAYKGKDQDGNLVFWGIGDRGPNGDSPKIEVNGKTRSSKVFLTPDFVPRLSEIQVKPGQQARVVRTVPLSFNGQPASGLPIEPGWTGSTGEVGLSDALEVLPYNAHGIDPEAIAVDASGNFWVSDEYGPFIMKVDAQGHVLQKYAPGKGLPEIVAQRQPNRGFEGLAVTPSGKVYAAVQSTLDVDGKTKNSAHFIRIVEVDPASGKTRQLAYPLDDAYPRAGDTKLGDLTAIDDSHFALIDQGMTKDGMRNVIYVVDIAGADDISNRPSNDGRALEYAKAEELSNLKFVRKQRVLDLRDLGWEPEKAEGLTLIPGGFAVINDNDFGVKTEIEGDKGSDVGAYVIRDGKINANGHYSLKPNGEPTQLWLVYLKKQLTEFFPR